MGKEQPRTRDKIPGPKTPLTSKRDSRSSTVNCDQTDVVRELWCNLSSVPGNTQTGLDRSRKGDDLTGCSDRCRTVSGFGRWVTSRVYHRQPSLFTTGRPTPVGGRIYRRKWNLRPGRFFRKLNSWGLTGTTRDSDR